MFKQFSQKFALLFVLPLLFFACTKHDKNNPVVQWANQTGAYNLQTDVSYLGITSIPDDAAAGIQFMSAPVTDAQLKKLSQLKPVIYSLGLANSNITDIGVSELAKINSLRSIDLGGTKITDESLKSLASLKQLRRLNLRKTGVTDAGLVQLQSNSNLDALDLAYTELTGLGFKGFTAKIVELYLNDTKINDHGVKTITKFNNIQVLDLSGTQITDRSIPELIKLSSLSSLTLFNCKLSITGKDRLRKHMPGTKILF